MLQANKKIKSKAGLYVELECDSETKKKLKEYVKQNINKDSDYDDFHTTLIYSKKEIDENIEVKTDVDKIISKFNKFTKFVNEEEDIYAIAIVLKCELCKKLHQDLMKKYDLRYDYDEYIPHVTLTYKGKEIIIDKLPKIDFNIKFDKINIEPLDEDWANKVE